MKNSLQTRNLKALPVVVMAVMAFAAAGASAQSDEVLTLDIKPQKAGSALVTLAKSSGMQILFAEGAATQVEVDGLKGEYRLEEALAALLTDTGLAYEFASENLVVVQEEEQAEESEETDEAPVEDDDEPIELPEQTVTGSRLIGGDPSARIYSYTAEQIAARGVSNLEDFFRKLPFVIANVTTQTGNTGVMREFPDVDFALDNGVGISSVNLRGMGIANTLVLMDGKRVAGLGGQEDDFVNLLNVPLAAIERVEIQLDGTSAVYGSDAIGGVVNFITKKDYHGLSAGYRHEYSSTDADTTRATINAGWGWGSGNITAILSRYTSKPITNNKTGWDSLDFRPFLGVEFDQRASGIGQPGVVCKAARFQRNPNRPPSWGCERWVDRYQLPADHSGVEASIEDFRAVKWDERQQAFRLDELMPENGADYATESIVLRIEQDLNDDMQLFASLNWSFNDSYQEYDRLPVTGFLVPASNAYNPFGHHVFINYAPILEYENGFLPKQYWRGDNERRTVGLGFDWKFLETQELRLSVNHSKSWRLSETLRIGRRRGPLDPAADAYYETLSSSDPDRAINLFGNGTGQGAAADVIGVILGSADLTFRGVSETRQYNLTLRGKLFPLWGGPVTYALGGGIRDNWIYSYHSGDSYEYELIGEFETELPKGGIRQVGVERPKRTNENYYFELALPWFGEENARAGLQSLVLTLQGRLDVNDMLGARSSERTREDLPARWWWWEPEIGYTYVETTRFRNGYDPSLTTVSQSAFSPRVGLHYKPTDDLTFRLAWRRSFKSPNWSHVFSTQRDAGREYPFYSSPWDPRIDPYDPDGPTELVEELGVIRRYIWYTPDLKPQHSTNWTISIEWAPDWLPGLLWTADLAIVDYTNKIEGISRWFNEEGGLEQVLAIPEVAIRNERGDLLEVHSRRINIAEQYNEMLISTLEYTFDTRFGKFTPRINYTNWLEDYSQLLPTSPEISRVGKQYGHDKYKLEGSLFWTYGPFNVNVFAYYTPGYIHDRALTCFFEHINLPESRCEEFFQVLELPVSSLTTVDLTLKYRMDNGLTISVGGRNILNRAAPRTLSHSWQPVPYDPVRWDARGRVLFMELNWEL